MTNQTDRYIYIKSSLFPPLPDENPKDYEDVWYGKALCQFLQKELPAYGFIVKRFVDEDFGWWVEVENDFKNIVLVVHGSPEEVDADFVILIDRRKSTFFSLKHFKKVSRVTDMENLETTIIDLMKKTDGVDFISVSDEFPDYI